MAVAVHRVLRPLTGIDSTGSLSHIPPGAMIAILEAANPEGFVEVLWDAHVVRVPKQDLDGAASHGPN